MADLVGSLLQSLRIAEGAGIDPEEEMLEILEKQLKVSPELIDALTCPLCAERMEGVYQITSEKVGDRYCGHSFCKPCLDNWIQKQTQNKTRPTCPLCQFPIVGIELNFQASELSKLVKSIVANFKNFSFPKQEKNKQIDNNLAVENAMFQEKERELQLLKENQRKQLEQNEADMRHLREKLEEQRIQVEEENALKMELEEKLNRTRQQDSQIASDLRAELAEQKLRAENGAKGHAHLLAQIKKREEEAKILQQNAQQEQQKLTKELENHRIEVERLSAESSKFKAQVNSLSEDLSRERNDAAKSREEVEKLKAELKAQEERERVQREKARIEREMREREDDERRLREREEYERKMAEDKKRQENSAGLFSGSPLGGVISYFSSGISSGISSVMGTIYTENWQGTLHAEDYDILEGRGESSSNVFRAKDKQHVPYAMKYVKLPHYNKPNPEKNGAELFEHVLSPEYGLNIPYYSAFREPMFLSRLEHSNIVKFLGVIKKPDSLISVMSLYGNDLQYYSYGTPSSLLTIQQIQLIMMKLLAALSYLHSAEIVHRNLNLNGILINLSDEPQLNQKKIQAVKLDSLGGFSTARSLVPTSISTKLKGSNQLSLDRIVDERTKMWRWAPELALLETFDYVSPNFDWKKVDVWALGCALATLVRCGEPLFTAKKTATHIKEIMKINELRPKNLQFEKNFPINAIWPPKGEKSLQEALTYIPPKLEKQNMFHTNPNLGSSFLHLISLMMAWDPKDRPSFQDCLDHPFFRELDKPPLMNASPQLKQSLTDNELINFVKKLI